MGDHTETVDIDYDPKQTDYESLLQIFWKNHDPTSKCSRQYMSAIFYHDEEQEALAKSTQALEAKKRRLPIATSILPSVKFYVAEDYHQKYMLQRHAALCNMLDIDPSGDELISSHVAARLNGYIAGYGSPGAFEEEWTKMGITEKCAQYVRKYLTSSNRGLC